MRLACSTCGGTSFEKWSPSFVVVPCEVHFEGREIHEEITGPERIEPYESVSQYFCVACGAGFEAGCIDGLVHDGLAQR
jgi:hypothetical protein